MRISIRSSSTKRSSVAETTDLLDVTVWLALSLPDHPHHSRAKRYWFEDSGFELAFCRITALGFLRLCTQSVVMADRPLSVAQAWRAYRAFRALPEVVFAAEPAGCESRLQDWAMSANPAARLWTDAYLAAFSTAGTFRLVSFDRDFTRFPNLDLLRLEV